MTSAGAAVRGRRGLPTAVARRRRPRTGPVEPVAAVDDPVPDGVRGAASRAMTCPQRRPVSKPRTDRQAGQRSARATSSSSSSRSFRLEDPALTTSTRTDSFASRSRPGPVRRSPGRPRRVRGCRRGRPAGRPTSAGAGVAARLPSAGTRSMTSMTRWKRSRSLSMTMSNGRGGGAFLLVAADVQVVRGCGAGRSGGGSATGSRGRRRHRLVRGEQGVEVAVGQPVRVLGVRLQAHQVDDVDDPDLQVRQVGAEQVGGGERLQGRDVAGAGEHDVGVSLPSPSVPAQGQIPSPRVQCAIASSMLR